MFSHLFIRSNNVLISFRKKCGTSHEILPSSVIGDTQSPAKIAKVSLVCLPICLLFCLSVCLSVSIYFMGNYVSLVTRKQTC